MSRMDTKHARMFEDVPLPSTISCDIFPEVHLVRPFPYDQLQRLTASQAGLLDRVSLWLAGGRDWSCEALEPVVGCPLLLSAREIRPGRASRRLGVSSQLLVFEHVASGERTLVELDALLALQLVWCCLSGALDDSMAAPRSLDQVEQGVLLYITSRVLWSLWGKDAPFRVVGVGEERDLMKCEGDGAAVHLILSASSLFGHAWIHLSPSLGRILPQRRDEAKWDCRLRWLPTTVHVVVGHAQLSAAQWTSLELGDAVLLDDAWIETSSDRALRGKVRIRLPLGRPRWTATLTEEGILGIDGVIDDADGEAMENADDQLPGSPGELLEEIPAVLSVELGRLPLSAQAALELRPGQTLRFNRRPGDPVELRIGPKLVGRGELVQIDGELGVIIREIFTNIHDKHA